MTIIKSTLAIAATIGVVHASTPASEATSWTNKFFMTGFYAGVELSDVHESNEYRESKTGLFYGNGVVYNSKGRKNSNSFIPGLFVGYRQVICPLFLGFELSANLKGNKSKIEFMGLYGEGGAHSHKIKYNVIPAIVLGVPIPKINGLAVYGKLGCDFGKNQHKIAELTSSGKVYHSKSSSKWTRRLLLGLGMEYALSETISSRFEFNHIFGKNLKFKMDGKQTFDNKYNTSIKYSSTAVKVGMFFKI